MYICMYVCKCIYIYTGEAYVRVSRARSASAAAIRPASLSSNKLDIRNFTMLNNATTTFCLAN